jgi:hypothetical protein
MDFFEKLKKLPSIFLKDLFENSKNNPNIFFMNLIKTFSKICMHVF